MSQNIDFVLKFEEKPEKELAIMAYAFDEKGTLIASGNVKGNQVQLKLTDIQAKKARIVLAPSPPEGVVKEELDFDKIQRRQAFTPKWIFDPRIRKYELEPIPKIFWKYWWWCKCNVRGKVVKKIPLGPTTEEWPVYFAKVHICEVDPVWLILRRLPEREIFRLRDELMKQVGKPIPRPPEPPINLNPAVIDASPQNVARSKMGMSYRLKMPVSKVSRKSLVAAGKLIIPEQTKASLASVSVQTVKQTLVANMHLIRPYLCLWPWIWPFFLRCDEVAVVLTDEQGKFNANVWYLCGGDHPDIYFWVEYQIGGAWTRVYYPPMICYTYWNYACGTEVTIPISDPRVPWYGGSSGPMPGKQLAVMTIGQNVSIMEIQRVTDANEGMTLANEPFAGSLEPTIFFGGDLTPLRDGDSSVSGVTHYRWSYHRLTNADGTSATDPNWHALDYRVFRTYGEIWPDGKLIFKAFSLGPDPDLPGGLFKIRPVQPPLAPGASSSSWAPEIAARENSASAFFQSHLLEGTDPVLAAGKYELKLELFKRTGAHTVSPPVSLSDENIDLKIPTKPAPFGLGDIETRKVPHDNTVAPDMPDRVRMEIRPLPIPHPAIVAFRLVLHIDNNPCEAEIYPVKATGDAPGPWDTAGPCGFIRYTPPPQTIPPSRIPIPAQALLSFRAAHPHNFARFAFYVVKGSTGYVNAACVSGNPVGTSLPMATANGFAYDTINNIYSKQMPVIQLVGSCPDGTAAFGEDLWVYALATDGWNQAYWLDRRATPTAFALQPKP